MDQRRQILNFRKGARTSHVPNQRVVEFSFYLLINVLIYCQEHMEFWNFGIFAMNQSRVILFSSLEQIIRVSRGGRHHVRLIELVVITFSLSSLGGHLSYQENIIY